MRRLIALALALGLAFAGPAEAGRPLRGSGSGGGGGSLPCDVVACAGAYSVRLVRAAYAGNALQLRRASDGTTQNIGFSGAGLDTASAATFCNATTCTVATWYDQSGNGFDVTQVSTSAQPTYSTSQFGSVPSLGFNDAVNLPHLKNSSAVATGDWTAIIPFKPVGTSVLIYCALSINASNACAFLGGTYQSQAVGVFDSSAEIHTTATVTASSTYVYQATRATNAFTTSLSGGTAATGTLTGFGLSNIYIGVDGQATGNFQMTGYIPEVLIFGSVLSGANATTIRTNQGTYFGITTS